METSSEVIFSVTLQIGFHNQTTSWIISSCMYDAIFRIPWHNKERI